MPCSSASTKGSSRKSCEGLLSLLAPACGGRELWRGVDRVRLVRSGRQRPSPENVTVTAGLRGERFVLSQPRTGVFALDDQVDVTGDVAVSTD